MNIIEVIFNEAIIKNWFYVYLDYDYESTG